jgi:hypothetical protein
MNSERRRIPNKCIQSMTKEKINMSNILRRVRRKYHIKAQNFRQR